MKFIITLAFALSATAATAQTLPVPRTGGQCPWGYRWSGSYCVPVDRNTAPAIPKPAGSPCPYGWSVNAGGRYCVQQ
jgi:hypothetical protein